MASQLRSVVVVLPGIHSVLHSPPPKYSMCLMSGALWLVGVMVMNPRNSYSLLEEMVMIMVETTETKYFDC